MQLSYWAATDVGQKRDNNEDNFLIDKKLNLFIVADGMGGHASGEVASSLSVHEIVEELRKNRDLIDRYGRGEDVQRQEILHLIEHAVQAACAAIYKRGQAENEKRGMGTTTSMLLVAGTRGFIAHVGDSRIYLLREGQVHQLTEDHSLINELVRRGKIKREEIDSSPYKQYKNAMTRAVGVYESVEVDTFDLDILPGDAFLLCSDGLHSYLDADKDLPGMFGRPEMTDIAKGFIDLANAGGGSDNITAVVMKVVSAEESAQDKQRAEDVALRMEILKGMPLFKFLTYKELVRMTNLTTVRQYAPGEEIIQEGSPGEEMFVILRGKVRLHKGEAYITSLGPGAHLGEMALVDRSPRSASANAEEPSRLLSIKRKDFYEVIRKEPALSVKLLWSFVQVLTERLRKTTADLSGARLEANAEDLSGDIDFEE
jgi:serine/threonine protein phosphatase PrpC